MEISEKKVNDTIRDADTAYAVNNNERLLKAFSDLISRKQEESASGECQIVYVNEFVKQIYDNKGFDAVTTVDVVNMLCRGASADTVLSMLIDILPADEGARCLV